MKQLLNVLSYIGIVLVFGALAVNWTMPEYSRYAIYATYTGLALVILYTIGQWREIRTYFQHRSARYGALAAVSVVVVLGIVVLVNYLGARRTARWDLTENSVNSLSEQTIKVLETLDAPMKMTVFDTAQNIERHRARMSMYDLASDNVSLELTDGDRDPIRAKSFEVAVYPTLVIEYKDKVEKVTALEERDITSAIVRATTGMQRKMYFVQGHGERDPEGTDSRGYAGVVQQYLRADNIAVEKLLLTQNPDVPQDATILAIAGPTTDYLDTEIESVKRYLARGGRLLLMLDPTIEANDTQMPLLTALAKEWGAEVGNDIIVDLSGRSPNGTFIVAAPPYPAQPITEQFRVSTVFPIARSVVPAMTPPAGRTVQPIVETAAAAWAETDTKGLRERTAPQLNADAGDRQGPVAMAVAISTPKPPDTPEAPAANQKPAEPETRLVVFGDADFAANAYGGQLGNADLFMNSVNWLTAQENLIAIRPREAGDSRLTITTPQMNAVFAFAVFLAPALVFGAAILVAIRRRR
jgi:ABC-type uncharacterized transport system involved in gliding motility auxiliary subunit